MDKDFGNQLTIIIPVMNREDYIETCLESIRRQTWQSFIVILIDDGSTDNTYQVCRQYTGLNHKMKIIRQKNQGTIAARMNGWELADTKYVMFVDSDDWLKDDMLEKMMKRLEQTRSDIVCCNYYRVADDGKSELVSHGFDKEVFSGEKIKDVSYFFTPVIEGNTKKHINQFLCNKIFRRELFQQISRTLPKSFSWGEDYAMTYGAYLRAQKVCFLADGLYCYRLSSDQMTASFRPQMLEETKKLYHYLCEDSFFRGLQGFAEWILYIQCDEVIYSLLHIKDYTKQNIYRYIQEITCDREIERMYRKKEYRKWEHNSCSVYKGIMHTLIRLHWPGSIFILGHVYRKVYGIDRRK